MPTPGQMNAQQASMPPELLAQIPERRGSIMGGGPQAMTQEESSLIGQVAALRQEIAELRRLLSPPSAVILTGPEVAHHFRRLTPVGAGDGNTYAVG
jgi:hypothetical protein